MAVVLFIVALEGRKVTAAGARAGGLFRSFLLALALIALLLGLGILKGIDFARAGEVIGWLLDGVGQGLGAI